MVIYPIAHLPDKIPIGVQTENGAREIGFNVSPWLDKWPDLKFYVWVKRPTETVAYPAAAQLVGDVLEWYVSDADTDIPGCGTVEVEGSASGIRVLTGEIPTTIWPTSRASTAEPPDPIRDWHDRLMEKINEVRDVVVVQTRLDTETASFPIPFATKSQTEIRQAVADGKACLLVYRDGMIYTYCGETPYADNADGDLCPTFIARMGYTSGIGMRYSRAWVTDKALITVQTSTEKAPNPNKLVITGAAQANYDGSKQVNIEIPTASSAIYVTATIGEAYSETQLKCSFDKTGAEVVAAIKDGKSAMCLLDMGAGNVSVFPVISYTDDGTVDYKLTGDELNITINQNNDYSGSMRMEMQGAAQEVRPTTPIYVTSDDYSVTTCSMTFAEIVACIEAGTLGLPIVWRKQWDRLVRIPMTVQSVQHTDYTIEYANAEGHGLYHNHDGSIGFAYNDGSVPVDNVAFAEQSDGTVMVQGVAFAEQDDGSVLWAGAEFEEQDDGSYLIS